MTLKLMQGNEACAMGALIAGCRFYAGYPITPSTEIAEILSRELPAYGGKFIQMEDEIASLAAVIGASVGGLKAMTATSGPGFSLMQENIGYAALAEIPCVIANVQRLGPSTGRPTSPAQGDVMQSRWGTHGDHPIIVLCPWSVPEMFELTVRAFNLAERYRAPVILLTDQAVAHMREKVLLPSPGEIEVVDRARPIVSPESYAPYDDRDGLVPPLAAFGQGYRYHVTGLLHDRNGFPTEDPEVISRWVARVFGKIEQNLDDILAWEEEGTGDAEILVVAYGSTARSAYRAVALARAQGRRVGFFRPKTIWPFPQAALQAAARRVRRVIIPEMNLGQLALEVERVVGCSRVRRINKAVGEMIAPGEILAVIEEG